MGEEADRKFRATLAEWLANGQRLPDEVELGMTVGDVVGAFMENASQEYRPVEIDKLRRAFRPLLDRFEGLPAAKFDVTCLEVVQRHLANDLQGQSIPPATQASLPDGAFLPSRSQGYHLSRATIRARINSIRRCWRWAEQRRLVPPGSWEHLRTLQHVKPGRTKAKESKIVEPVSWTLVEPALPHMTSPVQACVLLQWWSGMRPSEALTLTGRQLRREGRIWIYRPSQHKGAWRGRERVVQLGPRAQEVLQPLLKLDPDAALISPEDAILEIKAEKKANRKTKVQPSQKARAERNALRPIPVGKFYDVNSYRKAIHRACDRAGVPRWSPHQLRHACAARLFENGEFEAARAVLGHSRLDMTRHYAASADAKLAADAMGRHG